MPLTLRPYQNDLISRTRAALRLHKRVLLQAPTGAGKTALASAMMLGSSSRGKQTLFVCHRAELVLQTSKTLERVDVAHSFIAASWPTDATASVFVCSIDTLKARLDKLPWLAPDLVIWDECHHIGAAGWAKVMAGFDKAYHVGLSATPTRLDGSGLDAYFDEIVPGPSVAWLIEQGFLSSYRMFSPSSPELDKVRSLAGDYRPADAEKAMTAQLTGDAISHWKRYAFGLLTLVFATTVAHSEAVVAQFNAAGIPAAHLDGGTPKDERKNILQRLARGEIKVVSNVGLMTEGFDLSAAAGTDVTIDCVILLRPTQSLSLYLQMVGRALRWAEGKIAIILDHAGCALRHGLPDDERKWPLVGRKAKQAAGDDGGPMPLAPATCTGCFSQIRRPLLSTLCPYCGGSLVEPKPLPKHNREELRELKRAEMEAVKRAKEEAKAQAKAEREAAKEAEKLARQDAARVRKQEEWDAPSCSALVDIAKARGYDYPRQWAERRWSQMHPYTRSTSTPEPANV